MSGLRFNLHRDALGRVPPPKHNRPNGKHAATPLQEDLHKAGEKVSPEPEDTGPSDWTERMVALWDKLTDTQRLLFRGGPAWQSPKEPMAPVRELVSFMRQCRRHYRVTLDDLLSVAFPDGFGNNEFHHAWAREIWEAADQQEHKAEEEKQARGLPRAMQLAEFLDSAKLPQFLVEPMLQRGFLYTLTAPTFHGKTTILILLALCVAIGRRFADCYTVQGRVVIFAGENPDDTAQKFLVACEYWGLDPAMLPITILPGAFDLAGNIDDALALAAEGGPVALCLIDTSAAYRFDDDEDDNQTSKLWGQQLRRFTELPGHPAVITAAHPTKRPERDALLPRGGGAFLNEVDGNLTLWADLDAGRTDLHWQGKLRGPTFAPISFELHKHPHPSWTYHNGNPVPMVVAVPAAASDIADDSPRKLHGDKARAYEVLANIIVAEGTLGATDVPAGIRSVGENRWREVFYASAKAGAKPEAKRKAFGRAADELVNDLHMVGMAGGRVWLPRVAGNGADHSADVAGQ